MKPLERVEAWARRGTAGDMVVLAKLFACLEPGPRRQLLGAAAGKRQGQPADVDAQAGKVAPKTADDALGSAIVLLDGYASIRMTDKSELFAKAIEEVASMRMTQSLAPAGTWADEHEWLCALARDTRPRGDEAADLFSFAAGVDSRWEQEVFPDGQYVVAGSTAENEMASAEALLIGYESIRERTDALNRPPKAQDLLGTEVNKAGFVEWDSEAWVVNETEWGAAAHRVTVMAVAEFVANWRGAFFDALIAGQQPDRESEG